MINEYFHKSLWVFHFNSGSCNGCDIEILAALMPRHDLERFGIRLVGTPRHADVLLVTGPVTRKMADKLKRIYEQVPDPKVVIVIGSCGSTGGVFYESYNLLGPVDNIIPVDVYVPGCPPRPEAIIHGVVKAWVKLEKLRKGEEVAA
ncbi:MAG: NADH-quinone oxidoreductase subunit B family protein [Synergistetes bacterium]|nr:NADH-quinone oxidoreductase subunit B family protein [Synergistota bacterium]